MEDYNVEGLLLLVKALHTSILFILMFFACFFLYFSRLVQVVMKTALTVTLIIMMIVTRIPLVQVSVVAEVVELEVVVPEVEGVDGRGQRQRRAGNKDGGTAPPAGWSNILSAPAVHPYTITPGPQCKLPFDAKEI